MSTVFNSADSPSPLPDGEFLPKPFRTGPHSIQINQQQGKLPLLPLQEKPIWTSLFQTLMIFGVPVASSVAGVPAATLATLPVFILAILASAGINAWYGMVLFLIYSAMEGLYKYTSEYSPVVYGTAPILAVGVYLCWALSPARRAQDTTKQENTQPPFGPIVYAFALLTLLQIFNPEALGLITGIATALVWFVGPILLFVVTYNTTKSSQQVINLLYLIVGISVLVSAYALLQFALGGTWCYAHLHGYKLINQLGFSVIDEHGRFKEGTFRPGSTFGGAGAYAVFVSCGILCALCLSVMEKVKIWHRLLLFLGIAIMAVAILLSATRSILVILLFVAPICLFLNARSLKDTINTYFTMIVAIVVASAVFLFTVWFAGGAISARYAKTFSNPFAAYQAERLVHLVRFFDQILVRPLGIGMQRGTELQHYERSSLPPAEAIIMSDRESQWNTLQIDTGILGVVLMVALFIGLFRFYFQYQGKLPDSRLRTCFVAFFCVVMLFFIAMLAGPVLQSAYLFWIAVGASLAIPRIAKNELPQRLKLWESLQGDPDADAITHRRQRQLQLRSAEDTMGAALITQMARQRVTDTTEESE